ncbi:MBL fold metallo-hydrolase [Clostridium botulinum C]|uniref:ComEC/Rec2 family competence protein n=1 Tax=Clostridium botulinum TaxID=1491 RepID=UPI001E4C795C|nr:MBL fold metallo-hydrolase [Clostridium botulinum C]MCD3261728.1 MBL fold metallo-hydrolase [Clostridium botulinum C]
MLILDGILTIALFVMIARVIICALRGRKNMKKKMIGVVGTLVALVISCTLTPDSQLQSNKTKTVATQNQQEVKKKGDKKVEEKKPTNSNTELGQLKVHYIDVGQADSILVEQDKHFMLIDAGNNEDDKLVIDYLQKQGVKKLDYVIGTHPHEDHIGGMDKVIDNFDIGTLLMPKKNTTTETFKDVLMSAKNKGLKITQPTIGTNYDLGKATFTILAPKNHDYESVNNYSIVQKLRFGNTSFIFTGDAESISEMEMVNANLDLHADVLKVGHHGSKTSTCQAFLDKVSAKYSVISCGKDNKYKHPNQSTMDRLKAKNIPVYRTDESGTIVATSDGKNVSFNTSAGSYSFRDKVETQPQQPQIGTAVTPHVTPIKPTVKNYNNNVVRKSNPLAKKATTTKQNVSKPVKNSAQVWLSATGSKYHSRPNCGRMNPNRATKVSIDDAQSQGYSPCSKCM